MFFGVESNILLSLVVSEVPSKLTHCTFMFKKIEIRFFREVDARV